MSSDPDKSARAFSSAVPIGSARHIIGFVYFTFISYLSVGLPLAVLPAYIHMHMGYSAALAGLVISVQYIATLVTRPMAGRICDHSGARNSVLWGMALCTASGAVLIVASLLDSIPWLSIFVMILSRLLVGVGEGFSATGSSLWGILSAGPPSTSRVITFNGIATYTAIALGAPVGVVMSQHWGLISIGIATTLICACSFFVAVRKRPVAAQPGEQLSAAHVFARIIPHGMALALGGIGYSVLATFITLFFFSHHWSGAALCLTIFGVTFIFARLIFFRTIDLYGGFPVAVVCLAIESLAMILLWQASASWMAFAGSALAGFGFSFVYPALGVEVVRSVPLQNRGSALGLFSVFSDVSFFLTGPIAGAIIGAYGYSSAFLYALVCALVSLAIVVVLLQVQGRKVAKQAE
jgi:MFS family permease